MSIESMRDFLNLYRGGASTARQRRKILEGHRQSVQVRLNELVEMLGFIDYKIGMYRDEETRHEVSTVG
jgi:DNA-binding transcriptional MerR regulator